LALGAGIDGSNDAGRIRHPQPLAVPQGFTAVGRAADLYFRSESAWGGERLLSTESIGVVLFNAGYPLQEVVLEGRGADQNDKKLFTIEQTVLELPRGEQIKIEVASYELPAPVRALFVALVSAAFGSDS